MHQRSRVFIADPGQIKVLTDPFGCSESGGYSTDFDRPDDYRHPQFAGSGLKIHGNCEVDGASVQTQSLLVRCTDVGVVHPGNAMLLTVVLALLVLLLIAFSSMYYALSGTHSGKFVRIP